MNKLLLFTVSFIVGLAIISASNSQEVATPEAVDGITALISGIALKFPWVLIVLSVLGILRIVVKPLMAIIHSIVEKTVSKSDDAAIEKVEASPIYKGFCFVLDWLFSVKLIK